MLSLEAQYGYSQLIYLGIIILESNEYIFRDTHRCSFNAIVLVSSFEVKVLWKSES